MSISRVGRLTLLGEIGNDLYRTKCDCGYILLVAKADWGQLYGCQPCHHAEVDAREREAAEQAREAANAQKELARQERIRATYILPDWQSLDAPQRRLFNLLVNEGIGNFGLPTVVKLLGRMGLKDVTPEWAWNEFLLPLLDCNMLIEFQGFDDAPRAYVPGSTVPYAANASPASTFRVRGIAVKAMLKAETPAPAEPAPVAQERQSVDDVVVASLRDEFLPARCVVNASESDYLISLRAKYVAWREELGRTVCQPAEFEAALAKLDGISISNGKVRGLRLKRSGELVAEAMTAAEVGV